MANESSFTQEITLPPVKFCKENHYGYSHVSSSDINPSILGSEDKIKNISDEAVETVAFESVSTINNNNGFFVQENPLFTDIVLQNQNITYKVNPLVVPWAYQYSDTNVPGATSYQEAEVITDNDSSLFGLIAASVAGSEEREKLFRLTATTITAAVEEMDKDALAQRIENVFLGEGLTPALVIVGLHQKPDMFPGITFNPQNFDTQSSPEILATLVGCWKDHAVDICNKLIENKPLTLEDIKNIELFSHLFDSEKVFYFLINKLVTHNVENVSSPPPSEPTISQKPPEKVTAQPLPEKPVKTELEPRLIRRLMIMQGKCYDMTLEEKKMEIGILLTMTEEHNPYSYSSRPYRERINSILERHSSPYKSMGRKIDHHNVTPVDEERETSDLALISEYINANLDKNDQNNLDTINRFLFEEQTTLKYIALAKNIRQETQEKLDKYEESRRQSDIVKKQEAEKARQARLDREKIEAQRIYDQQAPLRELQELINHANWINRPVLQKRFSDIQRDIREAESRRRALVSVPSDYRPLPSRPRDIKQEIKTEGDLSLIQAPRWFNWWEPAYKRWIEEKRLADRKPRYF